MARFKSKACVANRNLKSLCVCICSFAKREKIDVMLFRFVYILLLQRRKLWQPSQLMEDFQRLKKKKSDYQILASLSMNNHFRSIRFKWLTLECSFTLTWYPNSPSLLENIHSKIENMSIQIQSITYDYESSSRQSNSGNSVF